MPAFSEIFHWNLRAGQCLSQSCFRNIEEYRSAVSVIRVHSVSFVFDDFFKEVLILQNIDASYS